MSSTGAFLIRKDIIPCNCSTDAIITVLFPHHYFITSYPFSWILTEEKLTEMILPTFGEVKFPKP